MTSIVGINSEDIIDINFYVTSKIFRDPVLARDNYIYEREAITEYIRKYGTSPLTGQPLRIDDLQTDDSLRLLAERHRNEQPSEYYARIVDCDVLTRTLTDDDQFEEIHSCTKDFPKRLIIIIFFLILLVGLILGSAIVGFKLYSTGIRNYIIRIH
jgi:hypothetical protein